jgi:hypothetical protein
MSKINREKLAESKIELLVYKVKPHIYRIQRKKLLEKIQDLNHTHFRNDFFQDGDCLIFNENERYEDGIIDVYHLKNWLEVIDNEILEFEIRPVGIYFHPDNMIETFFKFRAWVNRDYKSLYLPVVFNIFNKEDK